MLEVRSEHTIQPFYQVRPGILGRCPQLDLGEPDADAGIVGVDDDVDRPVTVFVTIFAAVLDDSGLEPRQLIEDRFFATSS